MAKDKTESVKPRISVLERRLQNPFGEPSIPILLKEPGFICRWFNNAISSDKSWRAEQLKGWEYVRPEMVVDMTQIGANAISPDQKITRGGRGEERSEERRVGKECRGARQT